MAMIDLAVFYDPRNWTLGFWEYGSGYTIVPGRHIGLDIGTQGQAKRLPALLPGPIVDWVDTGNLGRVYIQDVRESGSEYNYLSYCHMSRYDAPPLGVSLHQGELFGRLATGPKSVGFGHPNYPGSSWTGPHLHLVWHNKVRGAYMLGQNDRYGNPETLIRNILSTPAGIPGGYTPFDPEEDDMTEDERRMLSELYQELLPGKAGVKTQGAVSKVINDTYAAAVAARKASESVQADLAPGQAGVRPGGRILTLLNDIWNRVK